jgi:nucleotide-binding universal stress UspA family protein
MNVEMLVRSWPYGIDALPPVLTTEIDESLEIRAEEEERQGKALLDRTIEALSHIGFSLNKSLKRGDAAAEILAYAEENQIDLIIAGSRGLSQLQSWLLGSVSSKLTHYSKCSVLIVKKPNL